MKAMNLIVSGLMLMTLGLTGCGAVKDAKNANNMEKEGNARIATYRTETLNLYTDHSIFLSSSTDVSSDAKAFSWSTKTVEQKADIRKRLKAYSENVTRILEIGNAKHIKLTGDQNGMIMRRDAAQKYLAELDKHESKAQ